MSTERNVPQEVRNILFQPPTRINLYSLLVGFMGEIFLSKDMASQLFVTPWTIAYQAPLSMGFFKQEYWNGLPFSSPEALPDPGTESESPALQADFFTIWATREAPYNSASVDNTNQTNFDSICIIFRRPYLHCIAC